MSTQHDKQKMILELLVRGSSQSDAARIADVSIGYVSQLLQEPEFAAEVAQRKAVTMQDASERENRANKIYGMNLDLEEKILQNLQRQVNFMKPHEQMKLLQIVSTKKAPPPPPVLPNQHNQNATLVTIAVSHTNNSQFIMNNNKEIIAVGDTTLSPMSPQQLKDLARKEAPALTEQVASSREIMDLFSASPEELGLRQ